MTTWTCSCGTENLARAKFCMECSAPRAVTTADPLQDAATIVPGSRPKAAPAQASSPTPPPDASLSGNRTSAGQSTNPSTADELFPGQRVGRDSRYELLGKIGQGGMGSVWKARDTQLGRDVAIKRILGAGAMDSRLRERFQRETQALVGLRHANIVTVLDADEDFAGPYIVMEFVPGTSLSAHIAQGPMAAPAAVEMFAAICRGVSHAHKKGVVHRDIKPSNVMLDEDGTPKLLDFGLVRMESGSELSVTGVGMGTLDYAAPEQKKDASKADARSDIYALGLTFYQMLTGRHPVPLHLHKVPKAWFALLERATEEDPKDRYASADELISDLEQAQREASDEATLAQVMGKDDDLRCPKCRLFNSLEAKFCRACGESLRVECPACAETMRAGLKHCDQCSANVKVVGAAKDLLGRCGPMLEEGQLDAAAQQLEAMRPQVEQARLGAATKLPSDLSKQLQRIGEKRQHVRKLLREAEQLDVAERYEDAQEQRRKAVAIDNGQQGVLDAAAALLPSKVAAREAAIGDAQSSLALAADLRGQGLIDGAQKAQELLRTRLAASPAQWANEQGHFVEEEGLRIREQQNRALGLSEAARIDERKGLFEAAQDKWREAQRLDRAQSEVAQSALELLPAKIVRRNRRARITKMTAVLILMAASLAGWRAMEVARFRTAMEPRLQELRRLRDEGGDELRPIAAKALQEIEARREMVELRYALGLEGRPIDAMCRQSLDPVRAAAVSSLRSTTAKLARSVESPQSWDEAAETECRGWLHSLEVLSAGLKEVAGPREELQRVLSTRPRLPEGCRKAKGAKLVSGNWNRIEHIQSGIVLVLVPAGEFVMGSPRDEEERGDDETQHPVRIEQPFYMGVTEVTQAQWEKVMGSNPSRFQSPGNPVEQVSWDDCQTFVQKAGGGLRLPSEAEWEYACQIGRAHV